jgi:hypothetical protein
MKTIKSIILGSVACLALSSCNDYLDINVSPSSPTQEAATVNLELPWAQYHLAYAYAAAGYRAQFICQAFTATSRTSRDGCSSQWEATASMSTTAYQQFFVGSGPNLQDIYKKGMEIGAWHYAGAAKILRAYGFLLMCDMYGEMPYTEALSITGNPKYDDGESIYMGCLAEIEEGIELLSRTQDTSSASIPALSKGDSWNGGDTGKWIKMAYLLKARTLNQMSNTKYYDPDAILAALEKAQQSIDDDTYIKHYDVAESSSDFISGDPMQCSPLFDNGGMGGGNTTRITQWMVDLLTNFDGKGIEDPRANKIMSWIQTGVNEENERVWQRTVGFEMRKSLTVADQSRINSHPCVFTSRKNNQWYCATKGCEDDWKYVGYRSGSQGYYPSYTDGVLYLIGGYASTSSNVYLRPDSPTLWSTYAEACFIKAEVLMRKGDKTGAFNAYKAGIKANIDELNKMATNWQKVNQECPAFQVMNQDDIDNFMNNAIGTADNITMGKIMTQKFIAMLYRHQNWDDMRRHHYSSDSYMGWEMPYEYDYNVASTTTVPPGKQWERIKQCSHEILYNSNNLSAITPFYGDLDVWTHPVWWNEQ